MDDDTFKREMGHVHDKLDDMKDVQKEFITSCNERFKGVEKQTDDNKVEIVKINTHRKWAGWIATSIGGSVISAIVYILLRKP